MPPAGRLRSGPGEALRRPAWAGLMLALALGAVAPLARAQSSNGDPPPTFRLEQNFPNPFTPGVSPTIFTYHIDVEAPVRLTVYNLLAQEIAILVEEMQEPGIHRVAWEGTDLNGDRVPAGVYWYKLDVGDARPALRRLRVRDVADPSSETPRAGLLASGGPRQGIW